MAFNLWGGGKRQPPPAPFLSHRRNLGKSGLRVSCLGLGEGGGRGGVRKIRGGGSKGGEGMKGGG